MVLFNVGLLLVKTAGFMYQIEGSASGSIATAEVKVREGWGDTGDTGNSVVCKNSINKLPHFRFKTTIRANLKSGIKSFHIV